MKEILTTMGVFRTLWTLRNAIVIIVTPLLLLPLLVNGTKVRELAVIYLISVIF